MILETERLWLREITPEDAPAMYALNLDPEVIKYTGDPPFESVEATEIFIRNYPDYHKNGYGRWLVVRKTDAEILGWCGLKFLPETQETDVGYRFFKKFWGMGYATEAAEACLRYGFEKLGLQTIVARAMHENPASVQVMKKIGMTYWKETECGDEPGVCYKISKADFAGKKPE
ncbi:GNAT family N-acetyltransferase [Adhaeribacter sp. BT258]|uniref:GNAT family N-acetyltransferase n=1 Tax=Adhaeribacter terrigena TaxID=2793070 RepID=A0ABS1BZV0_9BACT|nr:GNAT family N-acetyltransferase [Adhaeribacter terrigena]MBK0402442.1 GNAT family N-acetyltransferase [Adhaeribacter terrigena]